MNDEGFRQRFPGLLILDPPAFLQAIGYEGGPEQVSAAETEQAPEGPRGREPDSAPDGDASDEPHGCL